MKPFVFSEGENMWVEDKNGIKYKCKLESVVIGEEQGQPKLFLTYDMIEEKAAKHLEGDPF